MVMKFGGLKVSREFRRVRGGIRVSTPVFIIEGRSREALTSSDLASDGRSEASSTGGDLPRFGFTITRKVGCAVERNRIRRRLKEALRTLECGAALRNFDYVVIASRAAHDYPFAELQDVFRRSFHRITEDARCGKRGDRRPRGKKRRR
ncbi:MAG: ribonuclease P protein component [Hyphomicrobiaceae bacterium]